MSANSNWDIFISYHGNSNSSSSSYEKAKELKDFFENHSGHKYKCFLCKRENVNDFYDAINEAILSAKHFILVACDKKGLSSWVADELKQFDGLRKIGKKQNSIITSFIFGDITIDDLINFNSVFSTKDIAFGNDGFDKLYEMINKSDSLGNKILSFNITKNNITNLSFLCPINSEFDRKVKKIVDTIGIDEIKRKINDDILVFESYIIKCALNKYTTDNDLLIFQVQNPTFISEYITPFLIQKKLSALIIDYNYTSAVFVSDGDAIPILSLNDFEIILENDKLEINVKKFFEKNVLTFIFHKNEIELPFYQSTAHENIPLFKKNFITNESWIKTQTDETNVKFYLYILKSLLVNSIQKNTPLEDEILNEIDFCSLELSNNEMNIPAIEETLVIQKKESLLKNEHLLWEYYKCIKSGITLSEENTKKLFSSKYGEIAYKIKEYYVNHSTSLIIYVFTKLYEYAVEEKENGFYSKYEFLVTILFELSIHNIFVLNNETIENVDLLNQVKEIFKNEYICYNKHILQTLICSYEKELVFGGKIDDDAYDQKIYDLLDDFEKCICDILKTSPTIKQNQFKDELLLLYRQRSVVWEQCGDRSVHQEDRFRYYALWKKDCESAIELSKLFNCDKEILGCVYLNLASAINRLHAINNSNSESWINDCLNNLDAALELLKTCSAERYVGYAYLHKSDCYEALLNKKIELNWDFNFSDVSDIVKEIRRNASYAMNIFKTTDDNVAKTSSMRLSIKGKILSSDDENLISNIKAGLKMLRDALKYCKSARYVNGMAACVKDFTFYNQLINNKGIYNELIADIKLTFFEEMDTFSDTIKLIDLDQTDILKIQEQTEQLVSKLLDY